MKFQCPKCETVMNLKEDNHICPDCGHSMSLSEAEDLFDNGKLIGLVEGNEIDKLVNEAKKKVIKKEEEGDDELKDDEKNKDEVDEDEHDKDKDKDEVDEDEHDKDEVDEDEHDKDEVDEDEHEDEKKMKKEAKAKKMKEAKDKKVKKESVDKSLEGIEIDVSKDVNAIFDKKDLSEDFKKKAETIYEAAIKSKLRVIAESIVESNQVKLDEAIATNKKELVEKLNTYLDYAIKTWLEENKVSLEANARLDMADEFIGGLAKLFKEHYIEVPEGRYDVLEGMAKENKDLKEQLDDEIKKNINHQNELNESTKREILVEATENLADTEKEKLIKLAEEVDFKTEEHFRGKISTLKEGYFNKAMKPQVDEEDTNNQNENQSDNDMINSVLGALKSSNQN